MSCSDFFGKTEKPFKLNEQAFTRVLSVRPCVRTGRDGFVLRETVVEYHQRLKVLARELSRLKIRKPVEMPDDTEVTLYGGNAVIFDEYGQVKYNIGNAIIQKGRNEQERQSARLQYLWEHGAFGKGASKIRALSRMHLMRRTDWYRSIETTDGEGE
jgi:hypothetical protein